MELTLAQWISAGIAGLALGGLAFGWVHWSLGRRVERLETISFRHADRLEDLEDAILPDDSGDDHGDHDDDIDEADMARLLADAARDGIIIIAPANALREDPSCN